MIDPAQARDFLSQQRLAVVGVSDDKRNFARTIYDELRGRGYDVTAVNPKLSVVDGDTCWPSVAEVPDELDGVVVMVHRDRAAAVVADCARKGVRRVWLFKGIGGAGSVSEEALALCRRHGIDVVAGACPLMFLEPVGALHRVHRGFRRLNRSLGPERRPAAPAPIGS